MLYPKLFTTLKNYSRELFVSDLIAGIVVGIIALPLAIAFSIASGVTPEKGLVTAIVAGFLISFLGGSRVQIGGPTGAFVVIVYGIVQKYGVDGLIVATMIAGVFLIIMGFARLGTVIQFVPHPVIVGFTSGIAVVIFSSQIKDFLGLSILKMPADFIEKWKIIFENIGSFNWHSCLIALGTVLTVALWPKISRRVPGSLIALVLSSLAVQFFHLPVETIGSRFGGLPTSLPVPHWPVVDFKMIQALIQPALTIALLGAIESLLSAIVADGMIGGRHRSNMELVAQGLANISSALFGGIPATGAIARTATNIKNGGRTPVSGIVHAITLLIIVLFLGRWAKLIPLSCLAGILAVVCYHMSEWRSFAGVLEGPRSGWLVLLTTFFITVFFDLTLAIELGVVLSAFLFMHRMASITHVNVVATEIEEEETNEENSINKIKIPEGVDVYEINGPFFFAVSHKFEEAIRTVAKKPKIRILRLRNVPVVDSTGLYSLKELYKHCQHHQIKLMIAGIQSQPLELLKYSGLYDLIGRENFFENIQDAIDRAGEMLAVKTNA